ncbi:TetR/AcrR family transcriptional regulator [Nocardia sp. NPDC049149]|uniref:TetR/AcrR family transcriptional regulator n=1 Tax=Nocardia sp. NPDC049149 TaxID=3364315 RepID=UPI0037227CEA
MSESVAKRPNRHDRRRAETRRRILAAADEVLVTHGDSATIDRIADVADVAVATIYQHFSGKDELYLALVDEALERNEQHMVTVYTAPNGPVERLIDAAAAYMHFYLESPRQYAMIESAGAYQTGPGTEAARALIGERVARMNGALESIVAAAVESGELRPLPPGPMTNFLRGTLNGVFALSSRPDALRIGHDEMREALRVGVELLLEASVADTLRGADGRLDPALCRRLREALADDPAPVSDV